MSVEKRTVVTSRFRAARLLVDDLRNLEQDLNADQLTWRVGSRKQLGTWTWKTVYTEASSVDELGEIAPKGRIYDFQVCAQAGRKSLVLSMAGPNSRFVELTYDGPGGDVPEEFWSASAVLKAAEKRGQVWHYAGSGFAPAIALLVPLTLLDQIGNFGIFYDAAGPHGDVAKAISAAVTSFLFLYYVAAGFASWAMASSVTLHPFINTSSLKKRAFASIVSAVRWMGSVHEMEGLNKRITLYATVIAAICAIGSLLNDLFG